MGVSWSYGGNHLTAPIGQTIMLCALDFHCDVCQVFLSITGQKIPHKYGALVEDWLSPWDQDNARTPSLTTSATCAEGPASANAMGGKQKARRSDGEKQESLLQMPAA